MVSTRRTPGLSHLRHDMRNGTHGSQFSCGISHSIVGPVGFGYDAPVHSPWFQWQWGHELIYPGTSWHIQIPCLCLCNARWCHVCVGVIWIAAMVLATVNDVRMHLHMHRCMYACLSMYDWSFANLTTFVDRCIMVAYINQINATPPPKIYHVGPFAANLKEVVFLGTFCKNKISTH